MLNEVGLKRLFTVTLGVRRHGGKVQFSSDETRFIMLLLIRFIKDLATCQAFDLLFPIQSSH